METIEKNIPKPKIEIQPQLYTISKVAALLGVRYNTVYNWIYKNGIKTIKLNQRFRIPDYEVKRILEKGITLPRNENENENETYTTNTIQNTTINTA